MEYFELDCAIEPLYPGRDILVTELAELDFDSFVDTDNGVKAYVPCPLFMKDKLEELLARYTGVLSVTYSQTHIPFQNWNAQWESQFEPIEIDETWRIRAPFHPPIPGKKEIIIAPKMSFGTGHHETTFLMCSQLIREDLAGKAVLDMGCGTGVLAILARLLGAKSICGIEIEEHAIENAIENAANNAVEGGTWLCGGKEVIPNTKWDLILANINKNVLVDMSSDFWKNIADEGQLWLSGFFDSDIESLKIKFAEIGFVHVDEIVLRGWALLKFKRV
ncbi:MAG: ribosomal protein L11 methyltransferase [Luteibaculaceae bacterium]|jgi:ribosomal protein L11 methyltransferase